MKKVIVFLSLFIMFCGFGNKASAQDNNFSIQVATGVSSPLLDSGLGFYVGVNPCIRITKRISAEGQASYMFTKINSSFLSGKTGSIRSVNTLAGGRLYVSPEDKKTRFFVNLLAGLHYSKEVQNDVARDGEFAIGLSTGIFVQVNKMVIGLTVDTPQDVVLKLGYSF